MTDDKDNQDNKPPDAYVPPQAIRLSDEMFAHGIQCQTGGSFSKYRARDHWGICVTGKSAAEGCRAGLQPGP
jgi:hypothetical protein